MMRVFNDGVARPPMPRKGGGGGPFVLMKFTYRNWIGKPDPSGLGWFRFRCEEANWPGWKDWYESFGARFEGFVDEESGKVVKELP